MLVTGPGLSMTQAIGAQPVLYLFPALALVAGYNVVPAANDGQANYGGRITNYEFERPLATRYPLVAGRWTYSPS